MREPLEQALIKIREFGRSAISDQCFNDTLTSLAMSAKQEFNGTIQPRLLIFSPDMVATVLLHQDLMDDRYRVLREIGAETFRRKLTPVAVFLITEAWQSHQTKSEITPLPPSEDPNREEIIMIVGCTIDFRHNLAHLTIIRNGDEALIQGSPYYKPYDDSSRTSSPLLEEFFKGFMYQLSEQRAEYLQN